MEFKDILQDLLNIHDMKSADLCRETGIPTSLMSNYLKGIKSPGTENSIKIANVFNISLDELAGRKKEKPAINNDNGLTEIKKAFIEDAIKLDDADIQTIHAFVKTLLSNRNQ